jgi:hypothetical protein
VTADGDPLAGVAALPQVFEAVEGSRGAVDALLRDLRTPALRRRVGEVTGVALKRSAAASARLELRGAADVGGSVEAGALRAATELRSLAQTWDRAPAQALARAHVLAASGLVAAGHLAADDVGRPRSAPGVADRLSALTELASSPTQAPAAVVAAVVHGELLALAPFATSSGVVARLASRLVLVARGLDPQAVTVPEEGHLTLGLEAYEEAHDGYRSGTPTGVGAWVVHCLTALGLGARVGREVAAGVADVEAAEAAGVSDRPTPPPSATPG